MAGYWADWEEIKPELDSTPSTPGLRIRAGFIYRVSQNRIRTREVDLLDGFQKALNLRSMIYIFHRVSAGSI